MSDNKPSNPARKIYKKREFNAFIRTIKAGQIAHWKQMAEAVGVDRETIREWSELPEAQEAIKQGIDYALSQMEMAGRKDWRMWNEKVKLLVGISDQSPTVINALQVILNKYEGSKTGGINDLPAVAQTEVGSSQSST